MRALRTTAAMVAVLLAAACSAKQEPAQPAGGDAQPVHGSLADCLKANGVTETGGAPVVLGPPAGVDQGTWDTAMKACSSLAPGPGAP